MEGVRAEGEGERREEIDFVWSPACPSGWFLLLISLSRLALSANVSSFRSDSRSFGLRSVSGKSDAYFFFVVRFVFSSASLLRDEIKKKKMSVRGGSGVGWMCNGGGKKKKNDNNPIASVDDIQME